MPRELTDNELHRLYRAVEVADISRTAHQETPIAIMTGGQPGSGKTGLTGIALQELASRGGAVVIDADRMREYNPDYRRLMASDPEHAADLTHTTAAQWASQLRDRAIFERRNLVVDGTMRDPDDVARVAKQLKGAGYIVDARVMAVPGDVSFAHARLRYELLDNEAQAGRVVNQRQHDAAYAGVPQSLERLEANKLVDRITIYDTARREVYQNVLEGGQWKEPPEAAKTLVTVRDRGRTRDERADYVDALTTIEAQTAVRTSVSPGRGPQDRAAWIAKIAAARKELAQFEQSPTYARAKAFDDGPSVATLARHPELDGAYKRLADLRKGFSPETPEGERDRQYSAAVASLSEQLHRGEIPKGDVGPEDSRRVINAAARERNLVVREPEPDRVVQGEVLTRSSQHTLVHVAGSDNIAFVYTRTQLERDIEPGEKLGLAHEQHGATRVMTQQQAQEITDLTRDRDGGMERSR
ncbi:toxin [Burkholderia pseudomallei]|uniref:zeta toxin family protein n=1 Tax=Burkholderia pseudomallei TaxID=28450 RepID=UPI0009781B25|nr:zeta toxin family protein [Burkholderia pseudomallei]ONC29734.1 toxin [Burkholderia pseudomallei]